jgi:hypothetical protein
MDPIAYTEDQIEKKEQEIKDRDRTMDLLKTQQETDKGIVKILKRGLSRLKENANTEQKEG